MKICGERERGLLVVHRLDHRILFLSALNTMKMRRFVFKQRNAMLMYLNNLLTIGHFRYIEREV